MMNVTVKKEQIIDGLQKAASIIQSKIGAVYLRSIWLQARNDTITIMSTDVNIEFTGIYPAQVKEEGQVGVNGRSFVELLRRLPGGEIKLCLNEELHVLMVEQGRRSYKLPTMDSAWFQPFPPFPEEKAVLWSGDFLQHIIDCVSYCISDDESTEGLSCLYLKATEEKKVDACGLNGHQFAMVRFINDELANLLPENGLLIQKKYVNELRKWLGNNEVILNISESRFHIRSESGNEILSIPRSANFTYPNYNGFLGRLYGENVSVLSVDRKEALDALDRLLIFNNESDRCTYLHFSPSDIELSAQGQETGSATEHLGGEFKGNLDRIAFPTRSLIDILSHFQSSTVEFTFTGVEGPCGITGKEDAEYTVIIMPMKISESSYYTEDE